MTGARGLTGAVGIVAGNGKDDGKGVPGPAADAGLGSKVQYAVASNGDIFLTAGSLDVLKVSGGQVSVFAQLAPGGGPGTGGVVIGPDDSVFVATSTTVVKFATDGSSTIVLTTTASGLSSSLGPIAVDTTGNVYVADGLRRVTRVGTDGSTTLVAGTGVQAKPNSAEGDGGPATASPLGAPTQIAIDAGGNVLIADTSARRVRRVAADGTITTIAGGGTTKLSASTQAYAPDGTKATDLQLAEVTGVAVDGRGRVYVADAGSGAIFRFGTNGSIELVIADQKGGTQTANEPANATRATNVALLAFDPQQNLLYVESRVIKRIAGGGS